MTDPSPLMQITRPLCEAALEVKAENVLALDVSGLSAFADVFVLATASSDRHARAIADKVMEAARTGGMETLGVEGYDEALWILIDLNDAIVHVFRGEAREHYDLERLWGDADPLFAGADREAEAGEAGA